MCWRNAASDSTWKSSSGEGRSSRMLYSPVGAVATGFLSTGWASAGLRQRNRKARAAGKPAEEFQPLPRRAADRLRASVIGGSLMDPRPLAGGLGLDRRGACPVRMFHVEHWAKEAPKGNTSRDRK